MSKETISLPVKDISDFARVLKRQLQTGEGAPSHLSLMNMLARAGGFRNYQHLRASDASKGRLNEAVDAVDFKKVERTLQHFDARGVLVRWPSKRHVQELSLWVMWSHFAAGDILHERNVNGTLNKAHAFDDAAILRRSLIGMKLMSRNVDGSDYVRIEQRPPAEAVAVIREVSGRFA